MNLKEEFESFKNQYDYLIDKAELEKTKVVFSKGEFYEDTPFSYQRLGFNQGNIYKDESKVKFNKNLYVYYFDKNGKLILTKQATSIQDQFYYTFFIWENNDLISSIRYDNLKSLINLTKYLYADNKLNETSFQANRGSRIEFYIYENNKLVKINGESFSNTGEKQNEYSDCFTYDGENLTTIVRHFSNGYKEQFFPKKIK
jgi:hypothetical protein